MFFENSTRTKISFTLAEKRLGADSINFSSSTSSVKKGETLKDTIQNIDAMKIDGAVIRHGHPGSALKLTEYIDGAVINAGDGSHEHPTQAILDMVTLKEKFGKIKDLKVGIIGDILNSRVARSDIFALKKLGAEIVVCGPSTLLPSNAKNLGVNITYNIDEVLSWCDVVIGLRVQLERMHLGRIPSKREYHSEFGLTYERINKLKKDIVIMHPGPMNRGVEIDSKIADSENAVILDQVLNGVASRMSILYLLLADKSQKL
jgi:aspartate carbamoyltransferase catalytic subunit